MRDPVLRLFFVSRQDTSSSALPGPIDKNEHTLAYLDFAEQSRSSQHISLHTAPQYKTLPCCNWKCDQGLALVLVLLSVLLKLLVS